MNLKNKYDEVHIRLNKISDIKNDNIEEFFKMVSSLYSQLDRVREYIENNFTGKFFSNITNDEQAMNFLLQIERYMDELEQGIFHFENRFIDYGGSVIDHAIIKKGSYYHLFYIKAKAGFNWSESPTNVFGHAVSIDLKKWISLEPVVHCSLNTFDSFQVWAPHVVEKDNKYYMFYTGVNENAAQIIGLAESDDLFIWKKYEKNPVISPNKWEYWGVDHWSNGRDPMVLEDNGTYYMYYTRSYVENGEIFECVGVSSSLDLKEWKDEGYIKIEDSKKLPPESPFCVKKNGLYYLFYSQYYVGTCCLVSNNPIRGFEKKDWYVIDKDISASEVLVCEDKYYITRITHEVNDVHLFDVKELVFDNNEVKMIK